MTYPKVSIVTPIHNGISHTIRYLKSIEKVTYPNFDVIIVDDGSTDNSAKIISEKFPEVILLKGDGSLWWSGATNLGVREAIARGADYVFTINNDTLVDKEVLSEAVKRAKANPRALVGSKVYYMDEPDRVWFFGARFDKGTADIILVGGKDEDFKEVVDVDFLTGMGILIPVEAFRDVGFFDKKNFPQYFGDSDFSLRAKKAGYRLLVNPKSKIYNDVTSFWHYKQSRLAALFFKPTALFSIRSQYNLLIRYRFYRNYWGKGYLKALLKFYLRFLGLLG